MNNTRNEKFLLRFAKNLKAARKARNMTQEDLADKAGLTLSQVARIETGVINTTISTVELLLRALDADANELFK